jgi:putative ABC transport system permease protein
VDASVLWVGAGLAGLAAVLLAYIPRLPSAHAPTGLGLASGGVRVTAATNRRLRSFAVVQIALSFVLLAGASMLVAALVSLQDARTGYDLNHVLAVDVPPPSSTQGLGPDFYQETIRRIGAVPGVEHVAGGGFVPWRDVGGYTLHFPFAAEGYTPANGESNPVARLRAVSPGFFDTLGVPILAGRDFTSEDRATSEPVIIVSQSVAQRMFPNGDALNHKITWTELLLGPPFYSPSTTRCSSSPRRAAGCSCARPAIRTRWCRRSRRRFTKSRQTSRSSAPRRSRTCARRFWRPIG